MTVELTQMRVLTGHHTNQEEQAWKPLLGQHTHPGAGENQQISHLPSLGLSFPCRKSGRRLPYWEAGCKEFEARSHGRWADTAAFLGGEQCYSSWRPPCLKQALK